MIVINHECSSQMPIISLILKNIEFSEKLKQFFLVLDLKAKLIKIKTVWDM